MIYFQADDYSAGNTPRAVPIHMTSTDVIAASIDVFAASGTPASAKATHQHGRKACSPAAPKLDNQRVEPVVAVDQTAPGPDCL